MHAAAKSVGIAASFVGCTLLLQGCGGATSPTPSPGPAAPTPPPPPAGGLPHCKTVDGAKCTACYDGFQLTGANNDCLYACTSDLTLGPLAAASQKGLMMDDTTHHWCGADNMHSTWANTKDAVKSVRISKAWESDWDMSKKRQAWKNIVIFLKATGAKALVGTSITCAEADDDADWADVKTLLTMIGSENVLAVNVGNEVDLEWQFGGSADCIKDLWSGGYYLKKLTSRIADLDALDPSWNKVKVTAIFSEYIFAGKPFVNDPTKAMVLPFVKAAVSQFKDRFVFSINNYPYFDSHNHLDPGSSDKCSHDIHNSTCYDDVACKFPHIVVTLRQRMLLVGAQTNELWVTETGWSSPKAGSLKWDPVTKTGEMAKCPDFSSEATMQMAYNNFLKWDGTVKGFKGPEKMFYFGMRDASNSAGDAEHFGLSFNAGSQTLCDQTKCKLQSASHAKVSVVV